MSQKLSAQFEFDFRTGVQTAIGKKLSCERQRAACADLNRERASGILEVVTEFSFLGCEKSDQNGAQDINIAKKCAELDVPLIWLKDLGITINPDGDLENRSLIKLPSGAEAKPYYDEEQGVVYKLYDLRKSAPTGKKCIISRIDDDEAPGLPEEERYRVGEGSATLREVLIKLALLNEIGGHPTEFAGLSQDLNFLIVKQPFATKSNNSEVKDLTGVIKRIKATKLKKFGLNCMAVWLEGGAYIINDLHKKNIMIDHDGLPTIIDALICNIPLSLMNRLPALKAAVEDAQDLRNGKIPENRYHLRTVPDEDL